MAKRKPTKSVQRSTARYRRFAICFWTDEDVQSLPPLEKLVAAYCITSPQSNRCGYYRLSVAAASEDLGMVAETFTELLRNVVETLQWGWDERAKVIFLPSWWKWNPPDNPNVLMGSLNDLTEVPKSLLLEHFAENVEHLDGNLRETFTQRFAKPRRNQEQEQYQEQYQEQKQKHDQEQQQEFPKGTPLVETKAISPPAPESGKRITVAEQVQQVNARYLHHHPRAAKLLTAASKEYRNIAARLKEGYSVDDLCAAIDGNHLSPFHCGQNEHGREWHGLELIMRSSSQITKFIEYASGKLEVADPRGNLGLLAQQSYDDEEIPE